MTKISQLLTSKEISEILQIKPRTFYRMLREERFPAADISYKGRTLRWTAETVQEWIDNQKPDTSEIVTNNNK